MSETIINIVKIETGYGTKLKPVLINVVKTDTGGMYIELRLGERRDAGRSRMVHINTDQAEAIAEGLQNAMDYLRNNR